MHGTKYQIEVNPRIPKRLERIEELANNLCYSWDRPTRALFSSMHPTLWHSVGHSPKAFLKRVDEKRLIEAAADPVFLAAYNRVLSVYDTYHSEPGHDGNRWGLRQDDLIAYFCTEFGFHESLPIYSGGLGILAGDHCKTASDLRLPFVGIGLLYRQGYFHQKIDGEGNQLVTYANSDFDDLPITPVKRGDGSELRITIDLPERTVLIKVWQARIGHVRLYLLDVDLEENSVHDRNIAHQLYGGDRTMRIEQEIVLGVGGVRAVREMGLAPTIWHINEGHSAFLVLERVRALTKEGLDFRSAVEAVAANTVFTTHTAVSAGHDKFLPEMIERHFKSWCQDLRINIDELIALGRPRQEADFNMTALAIYGARFHNGVSRIHGGVSARIWAHLWPQVEPEENPISFVTNGVHVPTFLATDWNDLFDRYLGNGWSQRLTSLDCWSCIHSIPDHLFWSVRQSLKSQMLYLVRHRITEQNARNRGTESHLDRILKLADPNIPNVLTIGFARRFATYKRATLLFQDLERLRHIVSDPDRPVLFIFAGKAHPADHAGHEFIRHIANVARMPEFERNVLLVEEYDLQLARRLVSGVDVWLNNPVYPLEACGTSGMKAGLNGTINLSVLDGWWAEAYDGQNGWAIKPATNTSDERSRDREEARTLYELLQDSVIPLYYSRESMGYSPRWLAMAKRSIATLLPRFNSNRTLQEYLEKFYVPAAVKGRGLREDNFANARALAAWKVRIQSEWIRVAVRRHDQAPARITFDDSIRLEAAAYLGGLSPDDVVVELLMGRPGKLAEDRVRTYQLKHIGLMADGKEHLFAIDLKPELCGKIEYCIRIYPYHPLLTHRYEMGMMRWL